MRLLLEKNLVLRTFRISYMFVVLFDLFGYRLEPGVFGTLRLPEPGFLTGLWPASSAFSPPAPPTLEGWLPKEPSLRLSPHHPDCR